MEKLTYRHALEFAVKKHTGTTRHNGNPYIIHPIRVSQEVHSIEEKAVALLHDVLEDTDCTIEELQENFDFEIVQAVIAITHRKDEPYLHYIQRCSENKLATPVKIADIADNLSDSPTGKAMMKMSYALEILMKNK